MFGDAAPTWEFKNNVEKVVKIKGVIHNIREMSDFAFILVRTARELIQCFAPKNQVNR